VGCGVSGTRSAAAVQCYLGCQLGSAMMYGCQGCRLSRLPRLTRLVGLGGQREVHENVHGMLIVTCASASCKKAAACCVSLTTPQASCHACILAIPVMSMQHDNDKQCHEQATARRYKCLMRRCGVTAAHALRQPLAKMTVILTMTTMYMHQSVTQHVHGAP
jgi:hypothetical protein